VDEAKNAKRRLQEALNAFAKASSRSKVDIRVSDVLRRLLGFAAYLTVVAALIGGTLYKEYFKWVLPGGRVQLSIPDVIEVAAREPLVLATLVLPLLLLAPIFLFSWLHPARKQFVDVALACKAACDARERLDRESPEGQEAEDLSREIETLSKQTDEAVERAQAHGWRSVLDDALSRRRPIYLVVAGVVAVYVFWRLFSLETLDLLGRLPYPSATLDVLTYAVAGLVALLLVWYGHTVDVVRLRYPAPRNYLAMMFVTVLAVLSLALMLRGEGRWWGYNTVSNFNQAFKEEPKFWTGTAQRSWVGIELNDGSKLGGFLVWVSSTDTYLLVHETRPKAGEAAFDEMKGVQIPNSRITVVRGIYRDTWTHISAQKKQRVHLYEALKTIYPAKWQEYDWAQWPRDPPRR
jgi:hypothetical protein